MAHALMSDLDDLVEKGKLDEYTYKCLADRVKEAFDYSNYSDMKAMAPLFYAKVGDVFYHISCQGEPGGNRSLGFDFFVFMGRADGSTQTPKGYWIFRIRGNDKRPGTLDAINARPLANYRNYRANGSFDDRDFALPSEMCWGFRPTEDSDDDEGDDNDDGDDDVRDAAAH